MTNEPLGSLSKVRLVQREYNRMNEILLGRAIERKALIDEAILKSAVLSRWSWFWKRIQFWKWRVVKCKVVDDWPKIRKFKYLWRIR